MALRSVDTDAMIFVPQSGHPGHCSIDEQTLIVVPSSADPGHPLTKTKKTKNKQHELILDKRLCAAQTQMP